MFRSFDQVIYVDINNDIVADLKNENTLLNFDYESMNSDEFFRYVRNNLIFESDREVFDNVLMGFSENAIAKPSESALMNLFICCLILLNTAMNVKI